ncbi:hypothetical protein HDV05_006122 [Chytridiales sp. JEL 0842]|nr:hypothetical protein HDV05_006122 [Chytridiales sp. JEL 0842]
MTVTNKAFEFDLRSMINIQLALSGTGYVEWLMGLYTAVARLLGNKRRSLNDDGSKSKAKENKKKKIRKEMVEEGQEEGGEAEAISNNAAIEIEVVDGADGKKARKRNRKRKRGGDVKKTTTRVAEAENDMDMDGKESVVDKEEAKKVKGSAKKARLEASHRPKPSAAVVEPEANKPANNVDNSMKDMMDIDTPANIPTKATDSEQKGKKKVTGVYFHQPPANPPLSNPSNSSTTNHNISTKPTSKPTPAPPVPTQPIPKAPPSSSAATIKAFISRIPPALLTVSNLETILWQLRTHLMYIQQAPKSGVRPLGVTEGFCIPFSTLETPPKTTEGWKIAELEILVKCLFGSDEETHDSETPAPSQAVFTQSSEPAHHQEGKMEVKDVLQGLLSYLKSPNPPSWFNKESCVAILSFDRDTTRSSPPAASSKLAKLLDTRRKAKVEDVVGTVQKRLGMLEPLREYIKALCEGLSKSPRRCFATFGEGGLCWRSAEGETDTGGEVGREMLKLKVVVELYVLGVRRFLCLDGI